MLSWLFAIFHFSVKLYHTNGLSRVSVKPKIYLKKSTAKCSIRTSTVAFYNCKSSIVMPTLASAVGTKSGRLFGQVIFYEHNKSKEKERKGTSVSDIPIPIRANAGSSINRYVTGTIDEDPCQVSFDALSHSVCSRLIPRSYFQELMGIATEASLSEQKSARKNGRYLLGRRWIPSWKNVASLDKIPSSGYFCISE